MYEIVDIRIFDFGRRDDEPAHAHAVFYPTLQRATFYRVQYVILLVSLPIRILELLGLSPAVYTALTEN